jgi:DNA invertase Pin-like site-specific DNA recombinase
MDTNTEPLPWLAYVRLSEDRDGTKTGIETQSTDLRELARHEQITLDIRAESDRSAFSAKPRPQFEQLLVDAAGGRYAGVIFWKVDRGFRRGDDWERFKNIVEERGIVFRSLRDGLDTRFGDPDTVFLLAGILVWQANKESKNTRMRQQRKQRQLAEGGNWAGGGRAFGLSDDWTAIVPAEATLIRQAADELLLGKSMTAVCREWNEQGVPLVNGGAQWRPSGLRKMITAWRLAGARERDGQLYANGNIPAILTMEQVVRLRAKFVDGKQPGRASNQYLFSGPLRCGVCGSRLVSKGDYVQGKTVPAFVCRRPPVGSGCGQVTVRYEPLERVLVAGVLDELQHPAALAAARNGGDDETRGYAEIMQAREGVRAKLAQLAADRYVKGLEEFEYDAARAALREQDRKLAAQLATSEKSALVRAQELLGKQTPFDFWADASFGSRQALLNLVLGAVHVDRATRRLGRFDPQRLRLEWRV